MGLLSNYIAELYTRRRQQYKAENFWVCQLTTLLRTRPHRYHGVRNRTKAGGGGGLRRHSLDVRRRFTYNACACDSVVSKGLGMLCTVEIRSTA